MFTTIMVPLDGSRLAEKALEPAAYLARLSQARLVLVRNQEVVSSVVGNPEKYPELYQIFEREEQENLRYLDELATPLRESGLSVKRLVTHGGSPAESIASTAADHKADLIVLTSHGRSGVSRFLLGSVAERLAKIAPCPVLIAGRHALPEVEPK